MNGKALIVILFLWPMTALSQGFAGLGQGVSEGFSTPSRGQAFAFPADHLAHPSYRIEWWYLTATLADANGARYGVQWTLFRSALAPEATQGWDSPQIWMGHAGLTTATTHLGAEKFARDGVGQAGTALAPFSAWIDDWHMTSTAPADRDALSLLEVAAKGRDWSYDLSLAATGPMVMHGDAGYSVKSQSGQASYYYSQPFYEVTGTLDLPSGPVEVQGQAWLDREWSSQPLDSDQSGWDWFSLHLEDGGKVMGFQLRADQGQDYSTGTWITADGDAEPLQPGAFQVTPLRWAKVQDRQIPVEWQVQIPDKAFSVTVKALNDASWMDTLFPYWEGPIAFDGSHSGAGYLEMTGYDPE